MLQRDVATCIPISMQYVIKKTTSWFVNLEPLLWTRLHTRKYYSIGSRPHNLALERVKWVPLPRELVRLTLFSVGCWAGLCWNPAAVSTTFRLSRLNTLLNWPPLVGVDPSGWFWVGGGWFGGWLGEIWSWGACSEPGLDSLLGGGVLSLGWSGGFVSVRKRKEVVQIHETLWSNLSYWALLYSVLCTLHTKVSHPSSLLKVFTHRRFPVISAIDISH